MTLAGFDAHAAASMVHAREARLERRSSMPEQCSTYRPSSALV